MSNVSDFSTSASGNNSAPPDGFPEGQAASTVNNAARELMAAIARWYNDTDGSLTTGGSGNAYTLTSNSSHSALADQSILVFRADRANTGSATLAVDGLTAKTIKVFDSNLASGDIQADQVIAVAYNRTNDTYDLLSVPALGTASRRDVGTSNGTLVLFENVDDAVTEEPSVASTSSAQTFAADDANTVQVLTGSTNRTWTVPPNSSVSFTLGTIIILANADTAQITVAAGSGVTINSASSLLTVQTSGSAALLKIGTDEWQLTGDLE